MDGGNLDCGIGVGIEATELGKQGRQRAIFFPEKAKFLNGRPNGIWVPKVHLGSQRVEWCVGWVILLSLCQLY